MSSDLSFGRRTFLAAVGAMAAAPACGAALTRNASRSGPEPDDRRGLARASDLLVAPGLAYLLTGTVGPSPKPVVDATVAAWMELETDPARQVYRVQAAALEQVRGKAAAMLRCMPDEVVLTRSTTDGMNAVAAGLDLGPGDRVVTTDQEHGGGRHCWEYLARRRGVVIDTVAIPLGEYDTGAIVGAFRRAITSRTRVMSFSHILYTTGLRLPVAELCALARENGCLSVVDGAQAVGAMDVDVPALGCDVYTTSGHKWLLGPKGTGLMCLREGARDRVRLMAEQAGREARSDSTGIVNSPGVIGLGAAMDYTRAIGIGAIEAHNLALRDRVFEALRGVAGLRVVSPPPGPAASALLTVQLPERVVARDLVTRLVDEHRVALRPLPQLPNGLRFSTHLFNTTEDVERAVSAVRAALG